MERAWTPPYRWVFVVATPFVLFSTLQAYRLNALSLRVPADIPVLPLLILNLAYWYVPALLTPTIFRLAQRYRLDTPRWPLSAAIHVLFACAFSVFHCACMLLTRYLLMGRPRTASWSSFAQSRFLENLDWTLMVYSTIVGLSYALTYYRETQSRAVKEANLETRLVEARLRTLEAELHPHFLFNTLHAISSLVHTNPDGADRMISRLSDLLRITFDRSGSPRISLHEELEFLQKYLEIEQTRFQDRLSVHFDIEPDTLDAEVPRLLLQPLVENAIKHGVSPKPGNGLVRITSRRHDEKLWLEVSDNGVGLTAGTRARLRNGVGLANTRDRLACLYGKDHRIEFADQPDGLAVQLEIPFSNAALGRDGAAFQVA
jgi:two-component system LytT family sensor kinase